MLKDCTLPCSSIVMMASGAVSRTERSRASRSYHRLGALRRRHVPVDHQDGHRISGGIAMERPLRCHHQAMAVSMPLYELTAPLASAQQLGLYLGFRHREHGREQFMRHSADRLLGRPAVERAKPLTPEQDLAVERAHDHWGQVEGVGELFGALRFLPQLLDRKLLRGDVVGDLQGAENASLTVPNRRHHEHDMDECSVFSPLLGFETLDMLAVPDAPEDLLHFLGAA